ncbi:hypothetical protein CDAR_116621 [Caerostris darwini]|uniref:Uncharacterized protein n=1 Tax=Caerostris darwini TaxID=1538125 RepID=A0AAV4R4R5_9ARAC|nr:hypothetical protein CDAR_116601 [Caerostris darwini]GIY15313.1 hypothetical protein CDAR_116621 [Caerostris darwini]
MKWEVTILTKTPSGFQSLFTHSLPPQPPSTKSVLLCGGNKENNTTKEGKRERASLAKSLCFLGKGKNLLCDVRLTCLLKYKVAFYRKVIRIH